jgi:hypothetical protein
MAPKYVNVDDVISAKKKFSSQLNDLHSDVISPSYVPTHTPDTNISINKSLEKRLFIKNSRLLSTHK